MHRIFREGGRQCGHQGYVEAVPQPFPYPLPFVSPREDVNKKVRKEKTDDPENPDFLIFHCAIESRNRAPYRLIRGIQNDNVDENIHDLHDDVNDDKTDPDFLAHTSSAGSGSNCELVEQSGVIVQNNRLKVKPPDSVDLILFDLPSPEEIVVLIDFFIRGERKVELCDRNARLVLAETCEYLPLRRDNLA